MNLLSLKNIFRTLLAKKGAKPSSSEHVICAGGVCANNWKPFQIKTDYPEKTEHKNQQST